MLSSLLTLLDILTGGLHKDKRKNCESYHEYVTVNDSSLVFKCVDCNKNYEKEFDED